MTALLAKPHLRGLSGDTERRADVLPRGATCPRIFDQLLHSPVDLILQPACRAQQVKGRLVLTWVGEGRGHRMQMVDGAAFVPGPRELHRAGASELHSEVACRHGVKGGLTCRICQAELDGGAR